MLLSDLFYLYLKLEFIDITDDNQILDFYINFLNIIFNNSFEFESKFLINISKK